MKNKVRSASRDYLSEVLKLQKRFYPNPGFSSSGKWEYCKFAIDKPRSSVVLYEWLEDSLPSRIESLALSKSNDPTVQKIRKYLQSRRSLGLDRIMQKR